MLLAIIFRFGEFMDKSLKDVTIRLRIGTKNILVESPLPPDPARVDQLLPLIRSIVEAAVDQSMDETQLAGHPITCCKGCSACCRAQPVPITPPEAYALSLLVDSLPEPRQSQIRERFEECVHSLATAGLIKDYTQRKTDMTREDARSISKRYFELKLACPFLEDDACSIYADRPFVCRQYLVTSPVQLCKDPFENKIEVVPMKLAPASATLATLQETLGSPQYTIPLVLALQFVEQNRAELERTFNAESLARCWIDKLLKYFN